MRTPDDLVAFVATERPKLVRACDLLLDDHGLAEEIAQEALLRAASRWEHIRQLDSPGGWAHRVAINLATSRLRRLVVARRATRRLHGESRDEGGDDEVAGGVAGIEVRDALQRLSPEQRRLLVLRHVLQWRATEIAEREGISAATVRQRLHRARAALREELGWSNQPMSDEDEEAADVR